MEDSFAKLEAYLEDFRRRLERIEARLQPEPTCMTYREAAQRLGVGLTKLKEMIARGEISTTRVGKVPMVTAAELRRITTPQEKRPQLARAERAKAWQPIPKKRSR